MVAPREKLEQYRAFVVRKDGLDLDLFGHTQPVADVAPRVLLVPPHLAGLVNVAIVKKKGRVFIAAMMVFQMQLSLPIF
jgi:hypothetical protein